MPLPRFHCPLALSVGAIIDLPAAAARHACRVLRLREGDWLTLFDGQRGEYVARIVTTLREQVGVEIVEWHEVERESRVDITLVQALQAADKMDVTLQKAVELGVTRFVPVASRRSVLKLEGERAVAEAGCPYLIFRTSWVYAARGGNFAKTMLKLGSERESLGIIADQIGAPTGAGETAAGGIGAGATAAGWVAAHRTQQRYWLH